MKRLSIYLVLIVFAGLLAGCQLFGSGDSNSDNPSSSYFPLATGSTWTYAVYDSVYSAYHGSNRLDSTSHIRVKVTVLKNVQVDSNHVTSLWQFQFPGQIDTVYVSSASDSVRLKIPTISYGPTTFILPLSIGQKWSGEGISGTYSVVSVDTLSFNGMSFSRVYYIVQTPSGSNGHNEFINIKYWIQPGVGIVKAHYYDSSTFTPTTNTSWKLLSYNIK
ncbi:MAG TPA: hypothetical protein VKA08_17210 [Balneolales bacterium]|nr:hypothetical protein [Balneolales bacterium]